MANNSEDDLNLAGLIVQALVGQVQDTNDSIIELHQEDSLSWKLQYIDLTDRLNSYLETGSVGQLLGIIDDANFYSGLAQNQIKLTEELI